MSKGRALFDIGKSLLFATWLVIAIVPHGGGWAISAYVLIFACGGIVGATLVAWGYDL